ncbi:hypothetical protein Hdeb2414_s0009g00321801 [Helianthus debilis subsp. tardiflorus]
MSFRLKAFRVNDQCASIVEFDLLHNICCVYDKELPKMVAFKGILEFMERLPIQKALTNQHLVFRYHIKRFLENAKYDEESKTITSIVSLNGKDKPIIITEQLVREVLDFPDDENSPTKFPERMVKGCMLRVGYTSPLNSANYLKSCFSKPYKSFIHSVVHALSHRKGGYDVMRDYQMNMVTALVLNKKYIFSKIVFHYMIENITSGSKTWIFPKFVHMMLDHAYPDLEKDENNDLLVLFHMDNETLKVLDKYNKNHPESKTKAEFFGFIKDKNYVDPHLVDHLKWRNEEEMKEASYVDELSILADFKETRNEWFLKGEKKKRSRKTTPKVQVEEGSSSQPKQKRQKKVVETLLVDEPEDEEPEAEAEGDVRLSQESGRLLRSFKESFKADEADKAAGKNVGEIEGANEENSSSSSSEEEIDETERAKRIQAEIENEKQLKRKRREDKDDELYNPSPKHVLESQTPPSSGGRKKASARKRVVSPKAARRNLTIKLNPKRVSKSKPPTPPKQPTPPPSPPPQTEQHLSHYIFHHYIFHHHINHFQNNLHHHINHQFKNNLLSPHHIFYKHLHPHNLKYKHHLVLLDTETFLVFQRILLLMILEILEILVFVNDEQVKKLEKKVDEVLVENKKLIDREKKLEKRVKTVEAENSSLLIRNC